MQAPLQARNDSSAVQPETARTERQEGRFVDNRPAAVAQRERSGVLNDSQPVLQQRALSNAIHNSPQMVAQRHQMSPPFGSAVRPQGDGAIPTELSPAPREEKTNNTGLPNQLKSGIESLSGMSMDHVKVHYNSDKPAQLQAHAYAQGNEIHLGAGQEKHLPHEAWHVVQQLEGRVNPTMPAHDNVLVNNDVSLETEADVKGEAAIKKTEHRSINPDRQVSNINIIPTPKKTVQRQEKQSIIPVRIIQLTTKKKKHLTAKRQQEKDNEEKNRKKNAQKKEADKQEKMERDQKVLDALAERKERKKTHAKQAAVSSPTPAAASASPSERRSVDDSRDSDDDHDHEQAERKEDVRDDKSKKSKPAANLNELIKTGAALLVDDKEIKIYIDIDQAKHQPQGFPIGSRKAAGTKFSPMLQPTVDWHKINTAPALKTWAEENLGTKEDGEFPGPGQTNQLGDIYYETKCVKIDRVLYIFYHCYPDRKDLDMVDNTQAQLDWKKEKKKIKSEAKNEENNARPSQSRNMQVKNAKNTDEVKKPSSSSGPGK